MPHHAARHLACIGLLPLLLSAPAAQAAPVSQWASTVIAVSSEYNSCPDGWSSCRALGAPDTFAYGDIATAWAPSPRNGGMEFISLGYAIPVFSTGALVRQTNGNGFVTEIVAIDTQGVSHSVWSGTDASPPGSPVDFTVTWAETSYLTAGLTIFVNGDHDMSTWEEIDAVQLFGHGPAAVSEPGSLALGALALLGLAASRRRRA